jgi:hypothetical protein
MLRAKWAMLALLMVASWQGTAAQTACSYVISGPGVGTSIDVGGTSVSLGDDAVTGALPIGFNFNFFGSSYNSFVISSNGFISFNTGVGSGCCSGQLLPNAGDPNNVVSGFWEDLNPTLGGSIGYGVFGTAPARRLVVSFTAVPHHPGGTPTTFQIKLYESSNVAEVVCIDCTTDGGTHTQGIENAGGTVAVAPSGRNGASFSSVNETTTFTPVDATAPTATCPSNISIACSAPVSYSVSGADNCQFARVTLVGGLASGATFPTGTTTVTFRARDHGNAGVFNNGAGGTFSYNEGDSPQTIALKACESVYGVSNCVVGACGSFTYYYRSGHITCNCSKTEGQFEFVYSNVGYSDVGQDYGGTNAPVNFVPFTRVKGPNGCSVPNTWLLANDRLGGNFTDCSFNVTAGTGVTPANAGPDQTLCGTAATLAGNAPSIGTGAWSIIAGAGGTVTTPSSPTSGFTGVAGTTYTLRWSIAQAPCATSTDDVIITLRANPTVAGAGPDQSLCASSTTLAGNTPTIGTGAWSIVSGAGGSIVAPSSPTSTFTGVAGTTYTIRWSISNAPCTASTDDVIIAFVGNPTVAAAGADQTICGTSTTLAGNVATSGSGVWTILSGVGGACVTPSSATSVFNGVAGNIYTLRWTITSAPCAPTSDDVVITTDQNAPTITCPANMSLGNDAGQCTRVVTYTAPVGSDNCPSPATALTAGLASGATFPLGTTTNTYTVTDASGRTASCSFTVAVADNEMPGITCPANITAPNTVGACTGLATFVAPNGTDNCVGSSTVQTLGLASGATFPVGSTTNTFRVTDAAGNTATCSFVVIVADAEAPVISCPPSFTAPADAGQCTAILPYPTPNGTDNCPGASTTQDAGLPTGFAFPLGATVNTFQVFDAAGNTAVCSFTATVIDNQAPVISCPLNITVSTSTLACNAVVTYAFPSASDNCPGGTAAQPAGLPSGSTFPLGTTLNTYVVTDASGNSASCSFTVSVADQVLPAITCPANISVNASAGLCTAPVTFTLPIGTDNCSGVATVQTQGLTNGANFPVGVTTNKFTVTDGGGNTASCAFNVTVADNQVPTITCPANQTVNVSVGACTAAPSYAAPLGTDNCTGATTTQIAGLASGATIPLGVSTNTFRVTDGGGNTASCTFTITVIDNQLPTITCPANATVSNTVGLCGAIVSYSAPAGADNCTATTAQIAGLASGATFPVGVTTNTFRATDGASNSATCSWTVTVNDTQAPSWTGCPANITASTASNSCNAVVTWAAPTAADNCAVTSSSSSVASGSTFALGTTTVTYTAADAASNTGTCAFTVTVNDNVAPIALCHSAVVVLDPLGNGSLTAAGVDNGSTDNCTIASTVLSQSTFTCANSGGLTIVLIVTDAAGNTATCTAAITVIAPAVSGSSLADTTTCGYNVSCNGGSDGVAHATGSGGCPGYTYLWSNGATTSTATGLGAGPHTVTITDGAGGTNVVTVTLTQPTALQATATATLTCELDSTGTIDLAVTGGNDCQGYTYLWSNGATTADLTGLEAGTYTVTVTDAAGCMTVQTATVGTFPTPSPSFTAAGYVLTSAQVWTSYQWLFNGNAIPGATAITHTATQTGSYSLLVTDANGCTAVSDTTNLTIVGIDNPLGDLATLSIYPNPARDAFRLHTNAPIGYSLTVTIHDMFGKRYVDRVLPELSGDVVFDLSAFSAGTYIIEVVSELGQSRLFRLVVQ